MKDPMDRVTVRPGLAMPPTRGPGSGKSAWVAFAVEQAANAEALWTIIDEQSATIRELQAEVELLRGQIAQRKPKGGRPRIDDETAARIEADLAAGYSQRQVAARCNVSAMTVSRIARRVAARAERMR
jgi:Trp operon repressor